MAKPVHVEIGAKDPGRAVKFYGDLFGWQFQEYEGSPTPYHMTQFSEDSGGAVFGSDDGPTVLVYYDVDDLDGAAARVGELGGSADEKRPVPGMGWYSHCTDTEGNRFGLWQSDDSAPAPQ